MDKQDKEVCSINIMFPVDSDEQAIDCKKKVKAALSDMPDAQVRFMIMPSPLKGQ